MKRKPALVIAAAAAVLGSAGIVAASAVTGANVFGFHVGAARPATAAGTTAPTEAPATDDAAAAADEVTLPPIVVLQTEFVDQYVTVTTRAGRSSTAAAPTPPAGAPSAPPPGSAGTAAPTAPRSPQATPAPGAPGTATRGTAAPRSAASTVAPTGATGATTAASASSTAPASTVFDPSKYPFKIVMPPNWGTRFVPPLPTPPAGKQWSECELHDKSFWECQYP